MNPSEPKPLRHYFDEGLEARQNGKSRHDNPYSAGSPKRQEWNAGFCATIDAEDDDVAVHSETDPKPRVSD